ncbi:hypothetical protein [Bartonella fuyuanensis]
MISFILVFCLIFHLLFVISFLTKVRFLTFHDLMSKRK